MEISESLFFCDPLNNMSGGNPVIGSNSIAYGSAGDSKTLFSDRNGAIRLKYNTGMEYRAGCNLSLPWTYGNPPVTYYPKYGGVSNWPSLGISQILSSSYIPIPNDQRSPNIIPLAERVNLKKYTTIQFNGDFRLNSLSRTGSECNTDLDWRPASCPKDPTITDPTNPNYYCKDACCLPVPNHATFYVSFILWHNIWKYPQDNSVPNVIYQLLPIVYSENGTTNIGGNEENIMGDQAGDRTYFAKLGKGVTANAKKLTIGNSEFEHVNIDVAAFSKYVLHKINPDYFNDQNPERYGEYFVSAYLSGWEIWGGYQTNIEMKNLSLKAYGGPLPGVTISDLRSLLQNFTNIFDYNSLVGSYGSPLAN